MNQHTLIKKHYDAIDTFNRESNNEMNQNAEFAQAVHDFMRSDEDGEYYYAQSYYDLQQNAYVDNDAVQFRKHVHKELKA